MAETTSRFGVLQERNYRVFIAGYSISYVFYWVTLLAIGWWMWETTKSAAWVGLVFFCDLFPTLFITPWASTLADRGDRFRILRTVLWIQVFTGLGLALCAYFNVLTPIGLIVFVAIEGALVGFSQPAFFGLVNRIVTPKNLPSAVALNTSFIQFAYILGPLLAGFLFSFGLAIAPLAFALNAIGTLFYLVALSMLVLSMPPERAISEPQSLKRDILSGISVFWTNKMVFGAIIFVIGCAIIQRPLISLMTGINDAYDLFSAAYFTLLTASFMLGSIAASLTLAARNRDEGTSRISRYTMFATIILFIAMFIVLDAYPAAVIFACVMLFAIGFGECFSRTGHTIMLQARTPENLRSRVMGNTFMFSRAVGALAVASAGILIDYTSFTIGMVFIGGIVAFIVSVGLFRQIRM